MINRRCLHWLGRRRNERWQTWGRFGKKVSGKALKREFRTKRRWPRLVRGQTRHTREESTRLFGSDAVSRTDSSLDTPLPEQMRLTGLPVDVGFQKGCFIFSLLLWGVFRFVHFVSQVTPHTLEGSSSEERATLGKINSAGLQRSFFTTKGAPRVTVFIPTLCSCVTRRRAQVTEVVEGWVETPLGCLRTQGETFFNSGVLTPEKCGSNTSNTQIGTGHAYGQGPTQEVLSARRERPGRGEGSSSFAGCKTRVFC